MVRHVLEELWCYFNELRGKQRPEFWWPRHIVVTVVLVLLAMFLAIVVGDNLGTVLELAGTTNAVALSLILPPLVYLRLTPGKVLMWKKAPAIAMLVFGLVDGIVSTVLVIVGIATR